MCTKINKHGVASGAQDVSRIQPKIDQLGAIVKRSYNCNSKAICNGALCALTVFWEGRLDALVFDLRLVGSELRQGVLGRKRHLLASPSRDGVPRPRVLD